MELILQTIENPSCEAILKTPAAPVTFPLSKDMHALIEAMQAKLMAIHGVGLAAPQVGHSVQIICVHISDDAASIRENASPVLMSVMLNPTYEVLSSKQIADWEGCFSVENTMGKVPRAESIRVAWQDLEGQQHCQDFSGFHARVLQHEIDHVHGKLILDRFTPSLPQGPIEEMMKIRMCELSPQQIECIEKIRAKQKTNSQNDT